MTNINWNRGKAARGTAMDRYFVPEAIYGPETKKRKKSKREKEVELSNEEWWAMRKAKRAKRQGR